jgi:hypothetical protein
MYRHKNPKPVLRSEDQTAIALNRDRFTYQPLRGRGAKSDNKTRAYRLEAASPPNSSSLLLAWLLALTLTASRNILRGSRRQWLGPRYQ